MLVVFVCNVGAWTFSDTFTVDWLDPSVKMSFPVYVPKFPCVTVTVTFCVAPLFTIPLFGLNLSQLALAFDEKLADQFPVPPQFCSVTVCVCGFQFPVAPVNWSDPGVTFMHQACIVKFTLSVTLEPPT